MAHGRSSARRALWPSRRLVTGRWALAWLALGVTLGVVSFLTFDVARTAAYLAIGKARANRGDLDGAIQSYTVATTFSPRFGGQEWLTVAYGYRGTAYLDKGEPAPAVDDLRRALALNPERPLYRERLVAGYVARGEARLEGGEPDGAIADLESALKLEPGHPTAPRSLALAYARRGLRWADVGQTAAALEDLGRALALQPQSAEHLTARALVLAQVGQHEAAIADFTRAIEQGPTWPAYLGRGRSNLVLRRYPQASADYLQARSVLFRLPEGQERSRGLETVNNALEELRRARPPGT